MNIMLLALFASVGVGLLGMRFSRAESRLCVAIATALTLIYFFHPAYMT
ncbi:MAG: hypothetical protein M3069_14805 [Chloroflexota bacterium]|nr:hypothetical protein [Chloroflexota bacterium]